ncbi:hypothetical protein L873DRAFT_1815277 [Choiromyces venosus 120613-1]|uniref:DUF3074 domain-containing protein n=1 Tax=Choiromyces venosus 120613-1 TaxID=1336337 RepID=A0A3N4JA95_9PEZI|nr:hypothetical protein L873DRAFT_1815277 [Choiromyces venosus 120613-1]
MAALVEALKSLSPTTFDSLPREDDLEGYLANCLRDARVLVSSLPPSEDGAPTGLGGVDELQCEWKPIKLTAKENPLGIQVFKLQSRDGKGTWFARRSVHAGIGFKRFRAGLEREFQQGDGKGVKEERGNVRGIGREKHVERKRCKLGQIEVNYLSAQFPAPSAPRDFVTACLKSSASPEDLSQPTQTSRGSSSKFRQFTMISRPLIDHPECTERQGYVRGQYESVEFIREIPAELNPHINRRDGCLPPEIKRVRSVPNLSEDKDAPEDRKGRKRGRTITFADDSRLGDHDDYTPRTSIDSANLPAEDPEQNPVEWIMISRSDPGGSVPRWMVERGTPGSIVRDAEKFLDWAEQHEDLANDYPEDEEAEEADAGASIGGLDDLREGTIPGQRKHEESKRDIGVTYPDSEEGQAKGGGLISSAIDTLSTGVAAVTPSVIYTPSTTVASSPTPSATPTQLTRSTSDNEVSDDKSDTASLNTFTTAVSTGSYIVDTTPIPPMKKKP